MFEQPDCDSLPSSQDIHSLAFLRGRPEHASCPQVPTVSALRPCPRSIQVGEYEAAISGGIWVAIRGLANTQHMNPVVAIPKRIFIPHR